MRTEFSTKWVGSKQPRKQRKYRYNAPLHIRHRFLSACLAGDLAKRFRRKSIPLRKGDEVEVLRGEFRKFRGNVERVDMQKSRIYIEGVKIKKADGSEVLRSLDPSNVRETYLDLIDKDRQMMLERKVKIAVNYDETQKVAKPGDRKEAGESKVQAEKPVKQLGGKEQAAG
ncbi:MAG: 50S ribosomal protein L24 [Candidatus Aenigmarchaeota archaeon]|nr:50S ribosomal protein L24 [Candidatus Aenigmarchaeota archaeon]